jgi:hypothetical protein
MGKLGWLNVTKNSFMILNDFEGFYPELKFSGNFFLPKLKSCYISHIDYLPGMKALTPCANHPSYPCPTLVLS